MGSLRKLQKCMFYIHWSANWVLFKIQILDIKFVHGLFFKCRTFKEQLRLNHSINLEIDTKPFLETNILDWKNQNFDKKITEIFVASTQRLAQNYKSIKPCYLLFLFLKIMCMKDIFNLLHFHMLKKLHKIYYHLVYLYHN